MHRLVVVRTDGITHDIEFKGWNSETAAYHYFNEAKEDNRVIYAVVYTAVEHVFTVSPKDPVWNVRSEHHKAETK